MAELDKLDIKVLSKKEHEEIKNELLCNVKSQYQTALSGLKVGEAVKINKTSWKAHYKNSPSTNPRKIDKGRKYTCQTTKDNLYWVIAREK